MNDISYLEEYDKQKTKILKYIMYKKRTEREIRQKFSESMDEDLLEDVIADLKENGYINDDNYISRAINEFMALKNMSLKEIRYKLLAKGLSNDIIDEHFSKHIDELIDYEIQSAKNIFYKKQSTMEETQIKQLLLKKGYTIDNIKEALSEVE